MKKNLLHRSLSRGVNGGESGSNEDLIGITNYLTIEALENGLTASLSVNACEYCVDGDGNWLTIAAGTATKSINIGQTLSFRGNLQPKSSSGIGTFTISKKCNLIGNCMSMLFGNDAANNTSFNGKTYAFYRLFYKCSKIVTVSSSLLPATTLSSYCYYYMFYGCTSLVNAPELPATTLANRCYLGMFLDCTSLVNAPALPATTLSSYCYSYMFQGCSSLIYAPVLSATSLTDHCYYYMFYGCTSLVNAPELPATTLANYCYDHMFYNTNVLPDYSNIDFTSSEVIRKCVLNGLFAGTKITDNDLFNLLPINSNGKYYLPVTTLSSYCYLDMFLDCTLLTTAPELPATILTDHCYDNMFSGCTSLVNAPELPATTLAYYCYRSMFQGCSSLIYAPELPATTLANYCYELMFLDCTSLVNAPALPATTLKQLCYYCMFNDCSKLNYIKMLATNTLATNCLSGWVIGVASTGTFIKHPDMTTLPTGTSGIPSGWTVLNATY